MFSGLLVNYIQYSINRPKTFQGRFLYLRNVVKGAVSTNKPSEYLSFDTERKANQKTGFWSKLSPRLTVEIQNGVLTGNYIISKLKLHRLLLLWYGIPH